MSDCCGRASFGITNIGAEPMPPSRVSRPRGGVAKRTFRIPKKKLPHPACGCGGQKDRCDLCLLGDLLSLYESRAVARDACT
jgi:hypothetical protein